MRRMSDEDLEELLLGLRKSLEASYQAQLELVELVLRVIREPADEQPVVMPDALVEPDPSAGPYTRQALIRGGRSTISVEEAAKYLGIGRTRAYQCVRNGEIPSLRLGHKWVVPVQALLQMLASR